MDHTTHGSFRIFRAAGIDVYLHWTWFLIAVIQINARPEDYQFGAWKVAEYVSLFGIVLLHEFGHALACRSVGGEADTIILWPLGGIAYVAPPARPGAMLWSIVAGPLVNLVLVLPTFAVWSFGEANGWKEFYPDVFLYVRNMAFMNLMLLIFNLVPIYPLDGGQILMALLWFSLGRFRALAAASLAGIILGAVVFLLAVGFFLLGSLATEGGVAVFGAMLAVISSFIVMRSLVTYQQANAVLAIHALPRHGSCSCPECHASPPRGPFWVCEHCQTRFDLFASRGKCSGCGAWYLQPDCPHCHARSHIDRWYPPAEPAAQTAPPA